MSDDRLAAAWLTGACMMALTLSIIIGATDLHLGPALLVACVIGGVATMLVWAGGEW